MFQKKKKKLYCAKLSLSKLKPKFSKRKIIENADVPLTARIELEKSLISATMLLLREYGIRKSGAAVRDAVDISHEYVGPKEAVSALSSLGFKASFGRLNIKNLSEEFFPLIAFKKMAKLCYFDCPSR